jgi:hypothetical protein
MILKQACEGWSIFWFGIVLVKCELRLKRRCLTQLFHNWIVLSSWPPKIQKDFTCLVVCESRLKSFLSDIHYMWSRLVLLFVLDSFSRGQNHGCHTIAMTTLMRQLGWTSTYTRTFPCGASSRLYLSWEMLSFVLEHPH